MTSVSTATGSVARWSGSTRWMVKCLREQALQRDRVPTGEVAGVVRAKAVTMDFKGGLIIPRVAVGLMRRRETWSRFVVALVGCVR